MNNKLARAVELLQAGELVAFPTETVYGLGADASNPAAVARIFAAKGRPADHPLIVHLPGAAHLEQWAQNIPPLAWELAEAFWPGPLTLILKRARAVPYAVTGGQETVGVRVPAHPLALDLLRAYALAGGGNHGMSGIAAPSANRFGRISPTKASHVQEELGDAVALVLDGGPCAVGIESTILDLTHEVDGKPTLRLLRPGHITPAQLARVAGYELLWPIPEEATKAPRVSGSLDAHYAPQTPLRIVPTPQLPVFLRDLLAQRRCFGLLCYSDAEHAAGNFLPAPARRQLAPEPTAYARDLYAALRELDRPEHELIVLEAIPDNPAWAAVADRLRRAAFGSGR